MPNSPVSHKVFDSPATYRICVRGKLEASWTDRLEGMSVRLLTSEDNATLSILEGELMDQAALHGVLTTLYNLHFSLLFLEYMDVSQTKAGTLV